MFRHILIPTDGSSLSARAVERGIEAAKGIGAKVTAVHVGTPFHVLAADAEALTDTREEYERHIKRRGREMLAAIEKSAKDKGVPCDSAFVNSEHPYEAIIKTAKDKGCDLILMASHGRKGVKGLLLGSETQKVLTHSSIPVLVYR
ncbi:MAG TPA: universal stress protein [Burkholderiales bacterium]|nr:universal stress protein [Burkholderiales bacterium]